MVYLISFLEGVLTFISPCLLPMLPVYLSYFAGGQQQGMRKSLRGAAAFILGFTLVFVAMGAMAGSIGALLSRHRAAVDLVSGLVVIFFGLHFLGVVPMELFKGIRRSAPQQGGFFSAVLFGVVFSLGWTPCVGAFLGSALMLASQQGHALEGMGMLLAYSLGLGLPFLLSAVLIDHLKGAFSFIKRHYRAVNLICGILLILLGLLMATGLMGRFLLLFS